MKNHKQRASVLQCFGASVNGSTAAQKHGSTFNSGQAATEIVLMLPLFVILAGVMISIGYMCWQGLKVQEAANLAARMQGQERIAGGSDPTSIERENGTAGAGDIIPSDLRGLPRGHDFPHNPPRVGSMFGRLYAAVKGMFNPGEQKNLFIPQPETGINTDRVKVARIMIPMQIWKDVNLPAITIEATAYGGEDPRMYGLPRWGRVNPNDQDPFYKSKLK